MRKLSQRWLAYNGGFFALYLEMDIGNVLSLSKPLVRYTQDRHHDISVSMWCIPGYLDIWVFGYRLVVWVIPAWFLNSAGSPPVTCLRIGNPEHRASSYASILNRDRTPTWTEREQLAISRFRITSIDRLGQRLRRGIYILYYRFMTISIILYLTSSVAAVILERPNTHDGV